MPDWVSLERIKIMQNYGAEVTLISRQQGGFKRAIREAQNLAIKKGAFLANQFANTDNILAHYETTGQEIINQLPEDIGGFVSGVGTGGTLVGIGKKLKRINKDIAITVVEPETMPLISKNRIIGPHKIEGIGDDFIPALLDKNIIDKIFLVNDNDAINMARKIAKDLGIGVGISSGAALYAAIQVAKRKENKGKTIVAFLPDNGDRYLSTPLFS